MDWLVNADSPGAAETVTALVVEHLRRRAANPGDVPAAAAHVDRAVGATAGGTAWVRLDWEQARPVLAVWTRPDLDAEHVGGTPLGHGVRAADRPTAELAALFDRGGPVQVTLPVTRAPTVDVDLAPERVGPVDGRHFPGTVAAILAGQTDLGATHTEAAEVAGSSCASGAAEAWAADHAGRPPRTAAEVAEAAVAYLNEAGGAFAVVDAGERRATITNRACPFGVASVGREMMCRTTSGLVGSLAARATERATVTLDEAIALGDHRCRLVVDLDAPSTRWNHTYRWPPAGPTGGDDRGASPGFRVAIRLRLPRDQMSVPLIRHMVGNSLHEVGAVPDDIHAVQLVVSEAAGNVIRHSDSSDAYDVEVSIGPNMVELRVIDVGRGFDSEAIEAAAGEPDPDAEHGRGMALMHALVDQARFVSSPERGTVVHLVKQLHFDEAAPARRLMLAELARRGGTPADRAGEAPAPG